MCSIGFFQSLHDNCLFFKQTKESFTILLVYVDDDILTGSSIAEIDVVKSFLHREFIIKDQENAKYFVGLEIYQSPKGMYINQRKYTMDIIQDLGMEQALPNSTPLAPSLKCTYAEGPLLSNPEKYRRLVGRFLYLSCTMPDISYSLHQLSQLSKNLVNNTGKQLFIWCVT